MGATESIFYDEDDEPPIDQDLPAPSHSLPPQHHSFPSGSHPDPRIANSNGGPRVTRRPKQRTRPRPQGVVAGGGGKDLPLKTIFGLILGSKRTGKHTLLERLKGKDPFENQPGENENDPFERKSDAVAVVPYQAPAGSSVFDRIQLKVQTSRDAMIEGCSSSINFSVILINPQDEPSQVQEYLIKVISDLVKLHEISIQQWQQSKDSDEGEVHQQQQQQQRSPPAFLCMCFLVNFRDLYNKKKNRGIQEADVKQCVQRIFHQLAQAERLPFRMDQVLVEFGTTSLYNCYGLATLHHFIYTTYLLTKRTDLEQQLLLVQNELAKPRNRNTNGPPKMKYKEFLKIFNNSESNARQPPRPSSSANVDYNNHQQQSNGIHGQRTEISEQDQNQGKRRVLANEQARNNNIVNPTQTPVTPTHDNAKQSLEDFLASDDEDDKVVVGNKKVSSAWSTDDEEDEDDFFFNEAGERCTAHISKPAKKKTKPVIKATNKVAMPPKVIPEPSQISTSFEAQAKEAQIDVVASGGDSGNGAGGNGGSAGEDAGKISKKTQNQSSNQGTRIKSVQTNPVSEETNNNPHKGSRVSKAVEQRMQTEGGLESTEEKEDEKGEDSSAKPDQVEAQTSKDTVYEPQSSPISAEEIQNEGHQAQHEQTPAAAQEEPNGVSCDVIPHLNGADDDSSQVRSGQAANDSQEGDNNGESTQPSTGETESFHSTNHDRQVDAAPTEGVNGDQSIHSHDAGVDNDEPIDENAKPQPDIVDCPSNAAFEKTKTKVTSSASPREDTDSEDEDEFFIGENPEEDTPNQDGVDDGDKGGDEDEVGPGGIEEVPYGDDDEVHNQTALTSAARQTNETLKQDTADDSEDEDDFFIGETDAGVQGGVDVSKSTMASEDANVAKPDDEKSSVKDKAFVGSETDTHNTPTVEDNGAETTPTTRSTSRQEIESCASMSPQTRTPSQLESTTGSSPSSLSAAAQAAIAAAQKEAELMLLQQDNNRMEKSHSSDKKAKKKAAKAEKKAAKEMKKEKKKAKEAKKEKKKSKRKEQGEQEDD